MAGFTDFLEKALLDHVFTDPTYTPATTLYIALFSGTATDDAGGGLTEVTSGAYARVSTVAADWSAATGTAPATKTNTAVKTFPTATANWAASANLTNFGIFDAITAGNLLMTGLLTTPKPVLLGDTASFAASALVIELGDPTDTF